MRVLRQAGIREYLVSPVLVSTLGNNDNWPSYVHRRVSTSASTSDSSSTAHANSLLQQRRENNEKHGVSGVPLLPQSPEDTVSAIRNDRVLDSCLAGGMAGSIISGTFRALRVSLPLPPPPPPLPSFLFILLLVPLCAYPSSPMI